MAWFSRFNPTPAFPQYTGPYKVGSVDVEIAASDLESPSSASFDVPTVAFRVFYPCTQESRERPVRWLPGPQRGYLGAYAKFLGANSTLTDIFTAFPQLLYYTTMPVHRNAQLHEPPTQNKRWPVMIFSHGLGGSRNSYSHICGSISSHGVVVIAPDHRDGSSPISYVRKTNKTEARTIGYNRYPHKPSPEVYEGRDAQLKIRLWELGLIHDALLKIDKGTPPKNLDPNTESKKKSPVDVFSMFKDQLNVHEPGAISFGGHSFGAATVVQLLKSTFYNKFDEEKEGYTPLFTPSPSSSIVRQVTPKNPLVLLDMWCLPFQSPSTAWLRDKPLPAYSSPAGGSNVLAILSEAFFKWTDHLQETKRVLCESPSSPTPIHTKPGPHFFYPIASAHLSQSDFGILFPYITTKIFGSKEPDRVLRLNTRAIMQVLRNSGQDVANTTALDMEEDEDAGDVEGAVANTQNKEQDWKILDKETGRVRGWIALSTDPEPGDSPNVDGKPTDITVEGESLGEMLAQQKL